MKFAARRNAARVRRWLRPFTQVGRDPVLVGEPTIYNEGRLCVGDRFRLASLPSPSHLVAGPGALLEIGNDVSIGFGAAIAAYELLQIGEGTRIGPYSIVMDTNFHDGSSDQSIKHDCRPIIIGRGCRIGSRVTITRGVTIGDGAEILAGSVVSSAIPAGACAAGARARIIGRAGDLCTRWESPLATMPEILMSIFDLGAPPNVDDTPLPVESWTEARFAATRKSIEDCVGLDMDWPATHEIRTFADLAAVVQRAYLRGKGGSD